MSSSPSPVEIVSEWFEQLWGARNEEVVHKYLAPRVDGSMEPDLRVETPAQFLEMYRGLVETFPDLEVKVDGITGCERHACVRWSASGTHLSGALGIPATGTRVEFQGMSWFTVEHGKIVAGHDRWNQGALFAKLLQAAPLAPS